MTVTAMPKGAEQAEDAGGKSPRKKLVVLVVLALVAGAAGWFFFLKPAGSDEPVAGEVMVLEPIQLNLAGGHYLRLGIALQLSEDAHSPDGSKALDAAISVFSGLEVADLAREEQREELRTVLLSRLDETYHGEVMEVYFTEFVTQ